jgi:hypothetical protein
MVCLASLHALDVWVLAEHLAFTRRSLKVQGYKFTRIYIPMHISTSFLHHFWQIALQLRWLLVPDESPPSRDKLGCEDWWPEGWGPGRRVERERDIFELLGLPFREFTQRNI